MAAAAAGVIAPKISSCIPAISLELVPSWSTSPILTLDAPVKVTVPDCATAFPEIHQRNKNKRNN